MKICVAIPTLNEEKNIFNIYSKIKKTKIKLDVLFVDDNSTDRTQKLILKLSKQNKNIKYIFRENKVGIGSAHKDAIKYIYKKKYDLLMTMDADGTHNPKYFKKLITNAKKYDYVITSRFIKPGLIKDWPLFRKFLTCSRHLLMKILLKMDLDATGAYRCFYLKKINLKDILKAKSDDYAFFWEVTFILKKKNYSIKEIPVRLIYRQLGESKMKFSHIVYSLIQLFKIFIFQK
jgi:dolichol-phosphate mannosyltransferase